MEFAFDEDSKLTPFKLETRLESPPRDRDEPEAKSFSRREGAYGLIVIGVEGMPLH